MIPTDTTLYVSDVAKSLAFYSELFGRQPGIATPEFGLIAFENGQMWALWHREAVVPVSEAPASGAEYGIPVPSNADLDALVARWKEAGVTVAQEPTTMDFGYTAVGLDPDGHRLRPYVPAPHTQAAQD